MNYEQVMLAVNQFAAVVIIEWLSVVVKKLSKDAIKLKYLKLYYHDRFFKTALTEHCFKNTSPTYIGYYIDHLGAKQPFPNIITFFCVQRAYTNSYHKRLNDWGNLLRKGALNNYESWDQSHALISRRSRIK